jgi:hypothetical protein
MIYLNNFINDEDNSFDKDCIQSMTVQSQVSIGSCSLLFAEKQEYLCGPLLSMPEVQDGTDYNSSQFPIKIDAGHSPQPKVAQSHTKFIIEYKVASACRMNPIWQVLRACRTCSRTRIQGTQQRSTAGSFSAASGCCHRFPQSCRHPYLGQN